ncbi:MAG: sugar ABC transporter ATP-binding protein, partial [Candidatus Dormibacteraeota bacterium]|nr:sugar ABC transporter ATP-binding protein [Candidatus Dormibacteraeota bacterium]
GRGLEVRGARRSFAGLVAVDGASLSVPAGTIVGLVGANGAGKSTLVNLISGVERLDSGIVELDGEDISRLAPADRTRRGIVRTFQVPRLVDELTVLENVVLGREASEASPFRRRPAVEASELSRARQTLAGLSLEHLADRPARSLGTGERKEVELARAVFSEASVVLLDEPAVGLALDEVERLGQWLRRMREQGMAVLVIDHNLDFVRSLADRIQVMEAGRIQDEVREVAPERVEGKRTSAASGKSLHVRDLSAGHGSMTVLHGVSFEVAEGEVLGVQGPNGAGKTTLLNALAGVNRRCSGEVLLAGTSLSGRSPDERVGQGLALVPEGRQVIGSLSVRANLDVTMMSRGRLRADPEHRARLEEVFDLFPALRELQRAPGSALSGGEQQMLAIARALMTRPSVLLLDEPSQGLAVKMVGVMVDALQRLKGSMTMVLVEQNVEVLNALSDRTLALSLGRVVGDHRQLSPTGANRG